MLEAGSETITYGRHRSLWIELWTFVATSITRCGFGVYMGYRRNPYDKCIMTLPSKTDSRINE
eukprot:6061304-Karenia_brevis.AAC.1